MSIPSFFNWPFFGERTSELLGAAIPGPASAADPGRSCL